MKKELICISCPIGCHLTVTWDEREATEDNPDAVSVEGNRCARGAVYGREEALAPKRVVTATVRMGRALGRLPVKTDAALPREYISGLLKELYALEIEPPVKLGQQLIENVNDTGVNVVATRSVGAGE